MAKLNLTELSAVLAEKHGIDRRTAQRFVTSVVAVVQSGLDADRMVKIKGLGTFKIIDVEARESVNVNTGERHVIDSHSKLAFLPDNSMKELVNRPFSQFETVVLNDGVEFNDVEQEEAPVVEDDAPAPVVEEEPVIEEEQVIEEDPIIEEEPIVEEESIVEEAPIVETETIQETGCRSSDEDNEDDSDIEQKPSKSKMFGWIHLTASALIALLVGGGAGYFIGQGMSGSATAPVGNQSPQEAQTVQQNAQSTATEEQPIADGEQFAESEAEPQVAEDTTTPIWEKYDAMDTRTHTGYYYITGLDRVMTAKAGDTSSRIAYRVFGASELACYIEVFNGINGGTVLEEGTEVKIPKIESKKAVKKRLEQQNNQQ